MGKYGYKYYHDQGGTVHQHMIHVKMDLDIAGRENTFAYDDITHTKVSCVGWSASGQQQRAQHGHALVGCEHTPGIDGVLFRLVALSGLSSWLTMTKPTPILGGPL